MSSPVRPNTPETEFPAESYGSPPNGPHREYVCPSAPSRPPVLTRQNSEYPGVKRQLPFGTPPLALPN